MEFFPILIFAIGGISMKLVHGMMGPNGAGKEEGFTVLDAIIPPEFSRIKITFSDILIEMLGVLKLPTDREHKALIAQLLEKAGGDFDEEWSLANTMKRRIDQVSHYDIINLDGMRWWRDYRMLRSFPCNFFTYMDAVKPVRFDGMRYRKRDGEETLTWEKFLEWELSPNQIDIPSIGKHADFVIDNSKRDPERSHLKQQMRTLYEQKLVHYLYP